MKRNTSKLLAFVITLAMIVSSTGLAFAGEVKTGVEAQSVKTSEETVANSSEQFAKFDGDNAKAVNKMKARKGASAMGTPIEYEVLDAVALYDSNVEAPAWYIDEVTPGNSAVVPVKAKTTGFLYVDAAVDNGSTTDTYKVYTYATYADAIACNSNYEEYLYMSSGEVEYGYYGLAVASGSTYYIVIKNESYNDATPTVTFAPYVVSTLTSRNLAQGSAKWAYASGENRQDKVSTTYFKVKPNMTGVMTVTIDELDENYYSTGTVTLLNSSKKALSNAVNYNEQYKADRVYFGVKKGTTYYLKVTNCYGSSLIDHGMYAIKYNMTSRTDRAIGTKSSAKKLTRKADATNTLFVASTGNSTDWYKFSVTSKRKTVVRINAESIKSGSLTAYIYCGTKYIGKSTIYKNQISDLTITNGTTYGKANKGTYYVKVVKGTKASGKYSIRYKE